MSKPLSRRAFLRNTLAGAIVIGFDLSRRSWLTAADVQAAARLNLVEPPPFDGRLVTDEHTLANAADDFGHIIHRKPLAVLQPGSVNDIVKLVNFARRHHIKVAARGQGHSTYGQAQVEAGIVIDMSYLARIRDIRSGYALVDAGVRWIDLLQQTVPQGRTPPILTDYIDLSIGGTLSVGGIGGQAFRWGTQTDNVLELEVVTGRGELLTCSQQERPALFNACRAGLGQCGIVVGARVRLVRVPSHVRVYTALYDDLASFAADQQRVIDDGRFDYVEGAAVPQTGGGWAFSLEAAAYFAPGSEPNDAALLAGLSFIPGSVTITDKPYFDFANRLAPLVEFLKQIGVWYLPHPWLNLFLPGPQAASFIGNLLQSLTVDDVGQGPVLIYPVNRSRCRSPLFSMPNTEHFFLLSLLRNAIPPTPERVMALIQANRQLYERCLAIDGKRYPIDTVPMSQTDWQQHFHPHWDAFVRAKQTFDPDNILTPGQGIFV